MVWFSTFRRKICYIAKLDVNNCTSPREDWKESERIQTQGCIRNIDVVLHPDQNFKAEGSTQCLLTLNAELKCH